MLQNANVIQILDKRTVDEAFSVKNRKEKKIEW